MPNSSPIQRIIFGSPGTGKSYRIDEEVIPNELGITDPANIIKTVFHPEYTYGDFMGKLMPLTDSGGKVTYRFYTGHFLKALARAYKNILEAEEELKIKKNKVLEEYKKSIGETRQDRFTEEQRAELESQYSQVEKNVQNVVLVIDELNRGNSSAIFGTVFQLLDRKVPLGWSQYEVMISELERIGLLEEMGFGVVFIGDTRKFHYKDQTIDPDKLSKLIAPIFGQLPDDKKPDLLNSHIKLPPNFSILATINTSDNSIYFMDNAFKRRWDWEFLNVDDHGQRDVVGERVIEKNANEQIPWPEFVGKLNAFIRSKYKEVRKIEDKQIGYFFINEEVITMDHIRNKLLFFVWDSVFSNNKRPLRELLEVSEPEDLVTFGQFAAKAEDFVNRIMSHQS